MKIVCPSCKQLLPYPEMFPTYYDTRRSKKVTRSTCKTCDQKSSRAYALAYPEKTRKYLKAWRARNVEKCREYQRKRRQLVKET